jgi:hypothetical protein
MYKNLNDISSKEIPYNTFTSYKLSEIFIVDNDYENIKAEIKKITNIKPTRYFVSKTLIIDTINVCDVDNVRFIEFENDLYEFTNKGINNSYEIFL